MAPGKKTRTPDGSDTSPAVGMVLVGGGSDVTTYEPPLRSLRVGSVVGGTDLKVTDLQGNDITIPNLLAGETIPAYVTKVFATGTDVSGIVGYY